MPATELMHTKSGIGARLEQRQKVPKNAKTYEVRSVSSNDAPLGGRTGSVPSNKNSGWQSSPPAVSQAHHSEAGAIFFAAVIVLAAGLLLSVFMPMPATDTQILQLPVTADPAARVWVHTRTGQYYCKDTAEFGKLEPGKVMSQHDAQAAYFRAAAGVCQ